MLKERYCVMKKSIILIVFLCLLMFSSCYSYIPDLTNLSPEEVIFEFNRILNRIDEPEYFKGILHITSDDAQKEADYLLKLVLLKETSRIQPVLEDLESLITYFKRLRIIVIDFELKDNLCIADVSYYDDKNKLSDLKTMELKLINQIWKISKITNK